MSMDDDNNGDGAGITDAPADRPLKVLSVWAPIIIALLGVLASVGGAYMTAQITLDGNREERQDERAEKARTDQTDSYVALDQAANELRSRLQHTTTGNAAKDSAEELVRKAETADARLQASSSDVLRKQAHRVGWLAQYAAECLASPAHTAKVPEGPGKTKTMSCPEIADALVSDLGRLRDAAAPVIAPGTS
ncbi:hypothetical protein V7793_02460 [Streptomyces sp. KLMMK]|uniref:hypothetical protein n=1 Tax=Streptomyces sp. KLMMK TaxID=3109353 RepID=UPI003000BB78